MTYTGTPVSTTSIEPTGAPATMEATSARMASAAGSGGIGLGGTALARIGTYLPRTIRVLGYVFMAGLLAWLALSLAGMPEVGVWALALAMPAWLAWMALGVVLFVTDVIAYFRFRGADGLRGD